MPTKPKLAAHNCNVGELGGSSSPEIVQFHLYDPKLPGTYMSTQARLLRLTLRKVDDLKNQVDTLQRNLVQVTDQQGTPEG